MLNGLAPILIFQLYKILPTSEVALSKIPLSAYEKLKATYAIIPIYLSEAITGILIAEESKNIDIDTEQNSLTSGESSIPQQKALGSITTITMEAVRGSVGLTILLALSEILLDKVTSQEYELTYMNGAVTVFGGLIHGFSYEQGGNDNKYRIRLELSRGRPKNRAVQVAEDPTAQRLGSVGEIPPPNAPTAAAAPTGATSGQSQISPGWNR